MKLPRRNVLRTGLAGLAVALAGILGLQVWSLATLEQVAPRAADAELASYLHAIRDDVQRDFRAVGLECLAVSADVIAPAEEDDDVVAAFAGARVEGVRVYFVTSVHAVSRVRKITLYDPVTRAPVPTLNEFGSYILGYSASLLYLTDQQQIPTDFVAAEETAADVPALLKPITGRLPEPYSVVSPPSRPVGVAGMILDPAYFKTTFLPRAIGAAVERRVPTHDREALAVTLRDRDGYALWSTHPATAGESAGEVRASVPFVFKDLALGIRRDGTPYDAWVRRLLAINVTISVLLAVALAAGTVYALRSSAREMALAQMKTDFVSNVSHELRTPLASIRVLGELLKRGWYRDPAKVREYGEYIESESRRLSQLVNNILDFSRIESGQKLYEPEPVDVGELVEETVRGFDARVREADRDVRLEPSPVPLPIVFVDPAAIGHALLNLLDNAAKYSAPSQPIVVRTDARDGYVRVSVADGGPGIPRDEQERIFERFHRVGTGMVHDVKGSGLGLAIVKHIVEGHAGRVEVESSAAQGSVFTICLPANPMARVEEDRRAAVDTRGD